MQRSPRGKKRASSPRKEEKATQARVEEVPAAAITEQIDESFLADDNIGGKLVARELIARSREQERQRRADVARQKREGTYKIPKFEYVLGEKLNARKKCVTSVEFAVSPDNQHHRCIDFMGDKVTVAEAVREVEAYLSVPITREYYEANKDDVWNKWSYEAKKAWGCEIRGEMLGSCKFLDVIELDSDGCLTLKTGS